MRLLATFCIAWESHDGLMLGKVKLVIKAWKVLPNSVQLPQGLANFAAAFNLSGGCNRQPFWTWLVGFDVHSVSSKSKKPVMNGMF